MKTSHVSNTKKHAINACFRSLFWAVVALVTFSIEVFFANFQHKIVCLSRLYILKRIKIPILLNLQVFLRMP